MAKRTLNGKGGLSLKSAVGALRMPDTDRLELGSLWVDLIIPNQGNQLFRARLLQIKEKGFDITDMDTFNQDEILDPDGKISLKILDLVHTCFVADWGGYGPDGKDCPMFDDDGDVVECSLENFTEVVRENEGGDALFFAVQGHIAGISQQKIQRAGEEKNSSGPSPTPPIKGQKRSTRSARKQATG